MAPVRGAPKAFEVVVHKGWCQVAGVEPRDWIKIQLQTTKNSIAGMRIHENGTASEQPFAAFWIESQRTRIPVISAKIFQASRLLPPNGRGERIMNAMNRER